MKKVNGKHTIVALGAIVVAIGLAVYAIVGGRTRRDILGSWVVSTENGAPGFQCGVDGIAASVHNDTIQYNAWKRKRNNLILSGKRFANNRVTPFGDTLEVLHLSATQLHVRKGHDTVTYYKIR